MHINEEKDIEEENPIHDFEPPELHNDLSIVLHNVRVPDLRVVDFLQRDARNDKRKHSDTLQGDTCAVVEEDRDRVPNGQQQ